MDAWAHKYAAIAHFVCVSCAGPDLAREFRRRLRLSACLVTYLDDGHVPSWGQLGCNGFIVLDAIHSVACAETAAFLQLRELAFAHVEALVDALAAGGRLPRVCPGQLFRLRGLPPRYASANGQHGLILSKAAADGRWQVQLRSGQRLRVQLENLDTGETGGLEDCGANIAEDVGADVEAYEQETTLMVEARV